MAFIIGAVIFTLVAICGYVIYNIKNVGKIERAFYDIFFLKHFFDYVNKQNYWNEIVRHEKILIKRRILIAKRAEDLILLDIKKEHIYDLRTDISKAEKSKMVYCITYEFFTEDKPLELCVIVNNFYPVMFSLFANTEWSLIIDSNKVKMVAENSFKGSMYTSSLESTLQSLSFIFHGLVQQYNETMNGTLKMIDERQDTDILIGMLKEMFNFDQYQRQEGKGRISMFGKS